MTEHRVPTRVGYYTFPPDSSDDPVRAAEFTWSPETGVSLTVFHEDASDLAGQYYDRGVPYYAQRRAVPRAEGATFMLALVQPSRSSYHHFVDESDPPEAPDPTRPTVFTDSAFREGIRPDPTG